MRDIFRIGAGGGEGGGRGGDRVVAMRDSLATKSSIRESTGRPQLSPLFVSFFF